MPKRKQTGNMIKDTMDEYKQWNEWEREGKADKHKRAVDEYQKHLGGSKPRNRDLLGPSVKPPKKKGR